MDLRDYHAGSLQDEYQYQCFTPSKIHHSWQISDPDIILLLGQANRALGELNAFAQLIPNIDFFIRMYVAKEATQSSKIEGTQTNIEDAFKDSIDLQPEERDDWGEIQNYIMAINYSIAQLETLPLSNRLLRDTHAILMQGVRGKDKQPGNFRKSQNWIGVNLKNAVFIPPHDRDVEDLMGDMEKFLHDEKLMVPPLVKIAIAHYQFETIHPFLDGNGRLGRLMISLYLASEKLLLKPALYLSDYFERNKTAYVDHLMGVRHGHHMREWLVFFLHGVEQTALDSISVFREILKLKERIEREILPKFSPRRQENAQKLSKFLYRQPVVDIKSVTQLLDTTPNTAAALVDDFVRSKILIEMTGQKRNRLFLFADYVDLFK